MKRILFVAALVAATAPALAANVGVSVSIGQPNFFGQIDIGGGYPPPRVLYSEPRVIERVPMNRQPIYLHVPPGHAKHWSKHCSEYNACDERVYFVSDNWYQNEYVPHYQEHHRDSYERHGDEHGDRGDNKHNNNGRDSGHGEGNGNKNGHGPNH